MPIQPVGEKNRKSTLGSYYAVRDYTAVNPEFGTLDDVKALVKQAHGLGMHVIIDWVANHTAFDNPWTREHRDWYLKNHKDAPFYTQLLALKHANPALWNGQYGGAVQVLKTGNDKVFAFRRTLPGNSMQVTVNVSNDAQRYTLPGAKPRTLAAGDYRIDAPRLR